MQMQDIFRKFLLLFLSGPLVFSLYPSNNQFLYKPNRYLITLRCGFGL